MSDAHAGSGKGSPPPPARAEARSLRLLGTLAGGGLVAGLILVFVYEATQPTIRAYKAEVLRQAIYEVLKAPDRYDTLFVYDGRLTLELPDGVDSDDVERVYLGYVEREPVGFAIAAGKPGFQDIIRIIFGYDAATNTILGMKVLESKETPGLGDKIEKDMAFVTQFDGAQPELIGVKRGKGTGDSDEIDINTGATISSRTVIQIINEALERLGPMLETYGEVAKR